MKDPLPLRLGDREEFCQHPEVKTSENGTVFKVINVLRRAVTSVLEILSFDLGCLAGVRDKASIIQSNLPAHHVAVII